MSAAAAPAILPAFEAFARRAPGHPALIRDGVAVGYGEVARLARAMARHLAREGLAPGDAVGIALADDWTHVLVALALLRLGCRQVALPPRDPAPLRAALAQRLGLVAVVGTAPADAPGDARLLRADPDALARAAAQAGDAPDPPPAGGAALIIGTSGTTGRPKLMAASEAMILAGGDILAGYGRVFLHHLTLDGNHGKRLTLRSLATGGTELLGSAGLPPEALRDLVARHGVQRLHLSPQGVAALIAAREQGAALVAARGRGAAPWPPGSRIFTTGTRIPLAFRRQAQDALGPVLHVQYGTTEAGMVSIAGPADHDAHPDAVGHLLPGVEARVVDDAGRGLPAGEEGLLRFRSPGIVQGYLDDPAATARGFHGGWFQPGDLGRIAPGGQLMVAGRRDDMMTLGIIKILPAEIEAAAEGFPGLRDCAAFALRSASLGDIPLLAAVAGPGFDAAALLAHCRARLGVRAPRKVVVVPALPRNATGKVRRRDLAELARAGAP